MCSKPNLAFAANVADRGRGSSCSRDTGIDPKKKKRNEEKPPPRRKFVGVLVRPDGKIHFISAFDGSSRAPRYRSRNSVRRRVRRRSNVRRRD